MSKAQQALDEATCSVMDLASFVAFEKGAKFKRAWFTRVNKWRREAGLRPYKLVDFNMGRIK
jgi:hypothetical protein